MNTNCLTSRFEESRSTIASGSFRRSSYGTHYGDGDDFRFECPQCRQPMRCNAAHRGESVTCVSCSASLKIPQVPGDALLLRQRAPLAETHTTTGDARDVKRFAVPSPQAIQKLTASKPPPLPKPQSKKSNPEADMAIGGFWCALGIIVTIGSYNIAQPGGTFIVAWGAILFGGLQFLGGLINAARNCR